jgi:exodeoxyribonuclease III
VQIATWNVNGVRARWKELVAWLERDRPELVCLQELKAGAAQIPEPLTGLPAYHSLWHGGAGGYSGVSLHLRRDAALAPPRFFQPPFDVENRIACADLGELTVASVYVPNGGRDYPAKLAFLRALGAWAATVGGPLLVCGDLNVTRTDRDVHPTAVKAGAIGQRDDERALFEELLSSAGLVDLGRALAPDDDRLYTWWPPWRDLRRKNRGWRIDYVLASEPLAARVDRCQVLRDLGTSDHAPVIARIAG